MHACRTWGLWEVPALFERCMRHLLASEKSHLSCRWKWHHILFLLVQHESSVVVQFIVNEPFDCPPLFSLFSPENYSLIFLIVGISTLIFILLIFNFLSWFFFCKTLIYFQFHHSIPNNQILYSLIRSSFFGFLFFFLVFL